MNYYDVFGISPTATPDDINSTHKTLAKKYHPDVNNSADAHEKMALLNEAHEVLSDTARREKYDNELRRSQQRQNQGAHSPASAEAQWSSGTADAKDRADRAEMLRRKAEARIKTEDAARKQRMEQAQQRAEETARRNRQAKADFDKQYVINSLSASAMNANARRQSKLEGDDERYYATKVLLSMIRKDDGYLQKMAEETERKQRIAEILTLVDEYNHKKEWV